MNDVSHRRVCEVKLDGNHGFTLRQQKYKVSETLKTGEAKALFGTLKSPAYVTSIDGVMDYILVRLHGG